MGIHNCKDEISVTEHFRPVYTHYSGIDLVKLRFRIMR